MMAAPGGQDYLLHGLALIAAALYVYVGLTLLRRPAQGPGRGALLGFVFWWFGLAVLGTAGVLFATGFDAAAHGLHVVRAVFYALFALIYLMLGGLVYYLLFLYTGRASWRWPVLAYFALQMLLLVYLIEGFGPYIGTEGGETELMFRTDHPPALLLAFSLGMIVPPLLAAVAYAGLYFQVDDPTSRYRVALVSVGLILWFGYSALSTITRTLLGIEEQGFAGRLVGQLFGLLAAVLVLLAYRPPRRIRARLGIRDIHDEPEATG